MLSWLFLGNCRQGRGSENRAEVTVFKGHLQGAVSAAKGVTFSAPGTGACLEVSRALISGEGQTSVCITTLPLSALLFLLTSHNRLLLPTNIFLLSVAEGGI